MNYLLLLQNLRIASADVLDAFMLKVTEMGQMLVTFLLLAFVYWCVDKRAGQLMAFNTAFGCWVNQWLKRVFKVERPWVRDERIVPVEDALAGAGGYSMPSGHTTRAVASWGVLGSYFWKHSKDNDGKAWNLKGLSTFLWIIVALVAFSRNYLGVHTFADVIVAFVIGVVLILFVNWLMDWVDSEDGRNTTTRAGVVDGVDFDETGAVDRVDTDKISAGKRDIIVCVIGCIVTFIPMIKFGCLSNAGAGYGFIIGWLVERRFVKFSANCSEDGSGCEKDGSFGTCVRKFARFIPGAIVIMLCCTSGTSILCHVVSEKYAGFFMQGFVALFIMCIYPFLFKLWESDRKKNVGIIVGCVLIMAAFLGALLVVKHYPKFTNVKAIAHRGYSGAYPENTMTSFEKAIELGPDMIELDVQETLDGMIVVFHDNDLSRVMGIEGIIGEYTYDELCQYDVGRWFYEAQGMDYDSLMADKDSGISPERIPTLAEVLELVKNSDSDVEIYLELKDISSTDELEAFPFAVVEMVDAYDFGDRVVYASFNYDYISKIKVGNPDSRVLFNTSNGDGEMLVRDFPADYYGLNYTTISKDTIDAIHAGGAKAYVYTVNTAKDMYDVQAMGVDGIVTNWVDLAMGMR